MNAFCRFAFSTTAVSTCRTCSSNTPAITRATLSEIKMWCRLTCSLYIVSFLRGQKQDRNTEIYRKKLEKIEKDSLLPVLKYNLYSIENNKNCP